MSKQDPMDALRQDPQGAALLSDQQSLAKLLASREAKALAELFRQMDRTELDRAARSAAAGDGAALTAILNRVAADPKGAQAMAEMGKKTGE